MAWAERILWRALRDRQLANVKFRRQVPIGPYIADFAAMEAGIVVEVDGGQHSTDGPERTRYLESRGFRIVRFWNNDLMDNLPGVLTRIERHMERIRPEIPRPTRPASRRSS